MFSTQSPFGSCLDSWESSMARKVPGGQQVVTGVLEDEAKTVGRRSAESKPTETSMITSVAPGSQLGPSNTGPNTFLQTFKIN